jgi:hypothetical protein
MEGIDRRLTWAAILALVWKDWGQPPETSVRISTLRAKIWTHYKEEMQGSVAVPSESMSYTQWPEIKLPTRTRTRWRASSLGLSRGNGWLLSNGEVAITRKRLKKIGYKPAPVSYPTMNFIRVIPGLNPCLRAEEPMSNTTHSVLAFSAWCGPYRHSPHRKCWEPRGSRDQTANHLQRLVTSLNIFWLSTFEWPKGYQHKECCSTGIPGRLQRATWKYNREHAVTAKRSSDFGQKTGAPDRTCKLKGRLSIKAKQKGKGKAIPLQAWTGPEGSRRLRLPDFKTIGTWRW